jgi:hypothetical protein
MTVALALVAAMVGISSLVLNFFFPKVKNREV